MWLFIQCQTKNSQLQSFHVQLIWCKMLLGKHKKVVYIEGWVYPDYCLGATLPFQSHTHFLQYSQHVYSLSATLQHSHLYIWIRGPDHTIITPKRLYICWNDARTFRCRTFRSQPKWTLESQTLRFQDIEVPANLKWVGVKKVLLWGEQRVGWL